jgi:hypothetical protein
MKQQATIKVLARITPEQKAWLEREAERNLSSQNSEIVRSLRYRMEAAERLPRGAVG